MRPSIRFEVFKRDEFTCQYCGVSAPEAILEVDHVHPRAEGGTDDFDNLLTACFQCNRGKGARLLDDAALDGNLHSKTVTMAERELQREAYTHWRKKIQDRENQELDYLADCWRAKFNGYDWNSAEVREFLRRLDVVTLEDCIEYVWEGRHRIQTSAWRLFCGMCWKRIRGERDVGVG